MSEAQTAYNLIAPGDRDDYMSVKKSVKKSKYERKMRKRSPEWGKSTPAILPTTPADFSIPVIYLEEIKPITTEQIDRLKRETIPSHLRGFIRSIVE